jgi:hypothetical protein
LESILGLHKSLKIRALAGRYDNPIHTRFLAPIDCLKIPAQIDECEFSGPTLWVPDKTGLNIADNNSVFTIQYTSG